MTAQSPLWIVGIQANDDLRTHLGTAMHQTQGHMHRWKARPTCWAIGSSPRRVQRSRSHTGTPVRSAAAAPSTAPTAPSAGLIRNFRGDLWTLRILLMTFNVGLRIYSWEFFTGSNIFQLGVDFQQHPNTIFNMLKNECPSYSWSCFLGQCLSVLSVHKYPFHTIDS